MFRTITIAVAAALAAPLAAPAQTIDTLQVVSGPTGARGVQILAYQPVGQSFTAIDANLTSFGFQFQTINAGSASGPVTWRLLAGAGTGGALVATRTLTLPTTLPTRTGQFYDFDITGTSVTVGQQYTALLTTGTDRYGVALGPEQNIFTGQFLGGDAYAGGHTYFAPSAFGSLPFTCTNDATDICDLNFEVRGFNAPAVAAAVPEPAAWATIALGFGILGTALRRRPRRALAFA